MTLLSEHTITATVGEVELSVISGSVTLDYDRVPYAQATIVCAIPDLETLDALDPRDNIRMEIELNQTFEDWNTTGYRAPESRTLDLRLVARDVDESAGTVSFDLWSDEVGLLSWALVAPAPERTYGLSVKDAVVYALAKVGATLEAGAADGTLVSKPLEATITNLLGNVSFETNTSGWASGSASLTLSRVTTGHNNPFIPNEGTCFARLTATGSVGAGTALTGLLSAGGYTPVTVGAIVTASIWVRSSKTQRVGIWTQFLDSGGSNVATAAGPETVLVANTWTRLSHTPAAAPASSALFRIGVSVVAGASSANWASGDTMDFDNAMVTAGATLVDYFDGATADTGLYDFAWSGTAHASASTKTNLSNTDATIWQPGTTAWDFLTPLLQATNLRLLCDEQRRWYLETSGKPRDGLVRVAAEQNVTEARDTISLVDEEDGKPIWYTGVVVHYKWTSAIGLPQEAFDVAGTGEVVLQLEYERPYPGPGAATNILARAAGRGRVFDLEAMSSYPAQPGMALVASIPHAPLQSGVVSAVTWSFPSNRMRVRSRALIDTPEGAYLLAPPTRTYATTPSGYTYLTYVN